MDNKEIYETIYDEVIVSAPSELSDVMNDLVNMGVYTKEEFVKNMIRTNSLYHPLMEDLKA